MAEIYRNSFGKYLMLILGWLMIIQVMISPLQENLLIAVSNRNHTESISDLLLNLIVQHGNIDNLHSQVPDEMPEPENETEEESSEKDETKFHELLHSNHDLYFSLLDKRVSQTFAISKEGFNRIPTPPPEA